ncbi:MAG TPA: MoxR family ATPase [Verrucomicrobiae bacterium]|nr:MoxR family ATPase [Verrucomicrobiae bacterium]
MEHFSAGDALRIYNEATAELSNVIYGEPHAKDAVLAAIAMRKPLILTGLPGGGKSTLSEITPSLIEDVRSGDVALISGQHDLTANQLIGGNVVTEKQVEVDGETRTERANTRITGIVTPSTKVVRLEEMNGTNPLAMRSLLPVLENKRIENSAGELEIPGLVTVIGTMNPTESRQSTFTISDAMASRFAMGALMGVKGSAEQRKQEMRAIRDLKRRMEAAYGADVKPADLVEPVTTTIGLTALRGYLLGTQIDPSTEDKLDELAIGTADVLEGLKVHETDRRIGQQIELSAKALGGLRNREHTVRDEDLHDAVRTVILARLGALRRTDHLDIEAVVQGITKF